MTLKCYDFLSIPAVTLSINTYPLTQHGAALTRTPLTLLHSSCQDYGHDSVFCWVFIHGYITLKYNIPSPALAATLNVL